MLEVFALAQIEQLTALTLDLLFALTAVLFPSMLIGHIARLEAHATRVMRPT